MVDLAGQGEDCSGVPACEQVASRYRVQNRSDEGVIHDAYI